MPAKDAVSGEICVHDPLVGPVTDVSGVEAWIMIPGDLEPDITIDRAGILLCSSRMAASVGREGQVTFNVLRLWCPMFLSMEKMYSLFTECFLQNFIFIEKMLLPLL